MSSGQEQRVAIARAIATDLDLLLADEPTGNLDAASAQEVMALLSNLNRQFEKTIVMVTNDQHAAAYAKTVWHLQKGRLEETAPLTPTVRQSIASENAAVTYSRQGL